MFGFVRTIREHNVNNQIVKSLPFELSFHWIQRPRLKLQKKQNQVVKIMYGRLLIYRPFLLIVRQSVLMKIVITIIITAFSSPFIHSTDVLLELIYKIFYLYIYKFYNRIWHVLNVSSTLMYSNINHLQNKLSIFWLYFFCGKWYLFTLQINRTLIPLNQFFGTILLLIQTLKIFTKIFQLLFAFIWW